MGASTCKANGARGRPKIFRLPRSIAKSKPGETPLTKMTPASQTMEDVKVCSPADNP